MKKWIILLLAVLVIFISLSTLEITRCEVTKLDKAVYEIASPEEKEYLIKYRLSGDGSIKRSGWGCKVALEN